MTALNGSVLARLNIEAEDAADPDVAARLGPPDRHGRWRNTRAVHTTILEHDPRWRGRFQFDEFLGEPVLDGIRLAEYQLLAVGNWIERVYGPSPSLNMLCEAVVVVSRQRLVHPVREYLRGLCWDGASRLDRFAPEVLGSEDTELNRTMCRKFLISAVARVMKPGCKADAMLVLVGEQGTFKSTACEAIVPDPGWYADTEFVVGEKDGYLALQGKWVYEIGEMKSIKDRGNSAIKAFLSRKVDRFRTPYGKLCADHPRQCVFIGTTNHREVLSDPTGGRRYWILEVGTIDWEALTRHRDQLWAEAVHHYEAGEPWWLPPDLESARRGTEERFRQSDNDREKLDTWLSTRREPFTTDQAIVIGLNAMPDHVSRARQMRIARWLHEFGYERKRERDGGVRKHLWYLKAVGPTG
jgi:putative DNA primase/helicase